MNLIVKDAMNNINYAVVSIAYIVIVCFAQVFIDSFLLQALILPFAYLYFLFAYKIQIRIPQIRTFYIFRILLFYYYLFLYNFIPFAL